jgi:hypothetical protein
MDELATFVRGQLAPGLTTFCGTPATVEVAQSSLPPSDCDQRELLDDVLREG